MNVQNRNLKKAKIKLAKICKRFSRQWEEAARIDQEIRELKAKQLLKYPFTNISRFH
jgi:hypothetical protein